MKKFYEVGSIAYHGKKKRYVEILCAEKLIKCQDLASYEAGLEG